MSKTVDQIKKEAKSWLENQVAKEQFVFAKESLEQSIYFYLQQESILSELNNQYLFIKADHETTASAFENNFWLVLFQFLNIAFDDGWYFTGHYSYQLSVENFSTQLKQISISTKRKSNNMITLPAGIQVLASYDPDFDSRPTVSKDFLSTKYFLLKPEYLVLRSTESEYRNFQDELIALLRSDERDEDYLLEYFDLNRQPVLLARLIGALRAIDDFSLRIELERKLKLTKAKVSTKNPFADVVLTESRERPAYLARFELSMQKAIEYLQQMKKPRRLSKKLTVRDLDKIAVDDAYHSLTIEGYTVTRALIKYLQQGQNLSEKSFPETLRDQLAAKGFMNILSYIKELNKSKFTINERLSIKLFQELWKPSIGANLVNAEFDIYRKHMVAIKGAQYVPPGHEKVTYILDEVFDYSTKIDNGFELGIFLHFFYVGVHPHSDGNGRISRFLMNLAFIKDKYRWLTIPSEDKKNYFAALEKSQLEDDISYFADYIKTTLRKSIK